MLAAKHDHLVADPKVWGQRRNGWVRTLGALANRVGEPRVERAMAWALGDQGGRDPKYRLLVDGARALAEKLDKIELAMDRSKPAPPRQPTLADLRVDEDWGRSESTNIRRG